MTEHRRKHDGDVLEAVPVNDMLETGGANDHLHADEQQDDQVLVAANEISIQTAMEQIGYGKFQILILISAGLCFMADAMEVLLLSFLSVVLQQTWNLSPQETALLTSIVFFGAMVGTLVLGRLGDVVGRRPIYIAAATIITVFGMATALCQNFLQLLFVRALVGFGVGGATVPFDVLAEVLPMRARGQRLLLINYFWSGGALLVPLFAFLTLRGGDSSSNPQEGVLALVTGTNDWRLFVILCSLPCALSAIFGILLVPESPRWLLTSCNNVHMSIPNATNDSTTTTTKSGHDRALAILRHGARQNGKDPDALFPLETTKIVSDTPEEGEASLCDLFSSSWIRITLALWVVWFGFAILYYGNVILATTVVFSPPDDASFDYRGIFISNSAEIVGLTFVLFTIDSWGRVPLQLLCYLLGGIAIFLTTLSSRHDDQTSTQQPAIVIVFAFLARMLQMSASCVTWVGTTEILTTEIRSSGHAAANAMARIGGFVAPFIIQGFGIPLVGIGMILLAFSIITSIAAATLPETKGRAMGINNANTGAGNDNELSGLVLAPETTTPNNNTTTTTNEKALIESAEYT